MQFKLKFDDKTLKKQSRLLQKNIPRAVKKVIDSVAFDLQENFKKQTVKKLDIVKKSATIRPFTKNAVLYKKSKINNLISTVFINDKKYEYLKYTIDRDMARARLPKKGNLLVPDDTYKRRRSYGQPQKRGGVKKEKDFWLKNRHGSFTLFERKKGKPLNAIWHTTKVINYHTPTLDYYDDMFAYLKKKEKYYTQVFFPKTLRRMSGFKKY
jgi:hypothetical protein|tara:strand:+ start:91 stop:723 length:633 start_codon:yes stop_codon:yes gene_type:complete